MESLEATLENRHRGCGRDTLGQTVPSTGSSNREGLITDDGQPWYREGLITDDGQPWYREDLITDGGQPWYREGLITDDGQPWYVDSLQRTAVR